MSLTAVLAIAVFGTAYVLIATDKVNRVLVALLGAAAMVVIGATRGHAMFFSERTGVDWNVVLLLFGMMVIVGVLRTTGIFEFLAIWAAQVTQARPFRMMALLVVITAVASALLDNVTTVLLMAPVTLLLCERLRTDPKPYLLAEVMASNIGGTATLIGDPPNIIIASRSGLSFDAFLVNLAPLVVVLLAVFLGLCWVFWGRHLRHDPERAAGVLALQRADTITDARLLRRMAAVMVIVVAGFVTHSLTHLEPSVIALLGAGAAILVARLPHQEYLRDVEWETLLFFAGLFVMVGSLVNQGVIGELSQVVGATMREDYLAGSLVVLSGSAALSGVVDNIPFVATMAPLVLELVGPAGQLTSQQEALWWALALGADLGGNASVIGASANVVVTGIAKRNGHPIPFWTFAKYGVVVTAATVGLSAPYLVVRYFVLG